MLIILVEFYAYIKMPTNLTEKKSLKYPWFIANNMLNIVYFFGKG